MNPLASFYVHGEPKTQGSKRAFPIRDRSGRVVRTVVVDSAGEKGKSWKAQVRDAAIGAWGDFKSPIEGPVSIAIRFDMLRPLGHYGSGRNSEHLRPSAPAFPIVKPDVLKMARAIEDSLTTVIYRDDSQIVSELLLKRYAPRWGVQIEVWSEAEALRSKPEANQLLIAIL